MFRAPGARILVRDHFLGRGNGSFSPPSFRMPFMKSKGTSFYRDTRMKRLLLPTRAKASASCSKLCLTKQGSSAGAWLEEQTPPHAYKEGEKKSWRGKTLPVSSPVLPRSLLSALQKHQGCTPMGRSPVPWWGTTTCSAAADTHLAVPGPNLTFPTAGTCKQAM